MKPICWCWRVLEGWLVLVLALVVVDAGVSRRCAGSRLSWLAQRVLDLETTCTTIYLRVYADTLLDRYPGCHSHLSLDLN